MRDEDRRSMLRVSDMLDIHKQQVIALCIGINMKV